MLQVDSLCKSLQKIELINPVIHKSVAYLFFLMLWFSVTSCIYVYA